MIGICALAAAAAATMDAPQAAQALAADGRPVRALVVGLSRFEDLGPEAAILTGEADAGTFAGALAAVEVSELVYLTGHRATRAAVDASLARLLDEAGPDEAVALFFTTHGVSVGRQSYLLTWDSRPEGRLPWTALDLRDLGAAVRGSQAGAVYLFADISHQSLDVPGLRSGLGSGAPGALRALEDDAAVSLAGGDAPSTCEGLGAYTCALVEALSAQGAPWLAAGPPLPDGPPEPPEGPPPGPAVEICLEANGEPVGPRHRFRSGDALGLTLSAPEAGYLYAVTDGPGGAPVVLYPRPGEDNRVRPGEPVSLPAAGSEAPVVFAAPAGTETLRVAWSSAPLVGEAAAISLAGGAPLAEAPVELAYAFSATRSLVRPDPAGGCARYQPRRQEGGWVVALSLEHGE